nr:uncharacterized protein LOC129384330 isoform X2 [Dermacentor andersoni]
MCELEPIPLMLEPMKDPKLISLSVCVPSPAYQLSLMRQYYPHQVLKITTVNYVLEDNPEFRLRLWNANVIVKEINLTLKDGDVGVDYQTFKRKEEYDDEIILDTKVDLNVNHKVHLKKGEYIVASVSCKMSEKTTCVNYRECTSIGTLQFEFNGVELVTYPMELKYLNVLFRALKIYGLKDRTSAREVHQEYSNVSESFALFTMQKMYDVAALQFRSFDNYLWAGDWAVVTGKYKYMNADFEGIGVGVTINGIVPYDMKDFVVYKDYPEAVTFTISVGVNASMVSTEDDVYICKTIIARARGLIVTVHNINVDNLETLKVSGGASYHNDCCLPGVTARKKLAKLPYLNLETQKFWVHYWIWKFPDVQPIASF